MIKKYKDDYKTKIHNSLNNKFLNRAMDNFAVAYRDGQKMIFKEIDKKKLVQSISDNKEKSINSIATLLVQFKKEANKKGIKIHYAKTGKDANEIISGIAKSCGYKNIIKSKSMTSEEIFLNKHLEEAGLNVTETDLGEWIIQLRKEGPSHMVMPAIHLSREQVSKLFSKITNNNLNPQDIQILVKVAREELKDKFIKADMGITGANFLLADSGSIGLVTNEGNARLVSSLPKTHVVLAGIDKILPGMKEALEILKVLPKNATGQNITSYVTWINGQIPCSKNLNNKKDIHIVILDNGRNHLAKNTEFSEVLKCVRCGACANVCPVYRMVGGHTMGYIYIGAIGLILTYFFHGEKKAEKLIGNCLGCGACKEICVAGIDLPQIIQSISSKIKSKDNLSIFELLLPKIIRNRKLFHSVLKGIKLTQKPFVNKQGYVRHLPMLLMPGKNYRKLPKMADKPFRKIWDKIKVNQKNPTYRIALFAGCVQDFIYPEQISSFISLLKDKNINIDFPKNQSCCGLPLHMMGYKTAVQEIALSNIKAFESERYDYIVSLCASCTSFLKNVYQKSADPDDNPLFPAVKSFTDKIITSGEFLHNLFTEKTDPKTLIDKKVTYHAPCHLRNIPGANASNKKLLLSVTENLITAEEEKTCCGFGGTYSMKFPQISERILNKKLEDFSQTGAKTIITECPGCIMQLKGGIQAKKLDLQIKHLSEFLDKS